MKDFWTEFRHVGNTTAARRGWQHAAEFLLCANPDHGQTLGELQRTTPWVWLWCERCQHHAPLACAVAVILWGPKASSDKLRAGARCTLRPERCDHPRSGLGRQSYRVLSFSERMKRRRHAHGREANAHIQLATVFATQLLSTKQQRGRMKAPADARNCPI